LLLFKPSCYQQACLHQIAAIVFQSLLLNHNYYCRKIPLHCVIKFLCDATNTKDFDVTVLLEFRR